MRKKIHTCGFRGCYQLVFAHHYCKSHQYLVSKSPIIPKDITFQKGLNNDSITFYSSFTTEIEMFKWIWKIRPHKSFLSNKDLIYEEGESLWYAQFAHVLPKGQNMFPLFKLNSNNVILLTPLEHVLLDNGTNTQRKNYDAPWDKIKALARLLWDEYNKINPNCNPLLNKYII